MGIVVATVPVTPSNFCNFPMYFSYKFFFLKNHTIFGRGTYIMPSCLENNELLNSIKKSFTSQLVPKAIFIT